ncbi:hypothetical protein HAX54_051749 [Datura stramonium]|uniref:Uncharacterized protein n=1 Tax=Datura stramonium TaxID=4076 RepID=A0ABS8WRR1_DATST|nr:hypothetical protein [Datura stramonium]
MGSVQDQLTLMLFSLGRRSLHHRISTRPTDPDVVFIGEEAAFVADSIINVDDHDKLTPPEEKKEVPVKETLPLIFRFEDEEPLPPRKEDWEKRIEDLFGEMDMCILESLIGFTNTSVSPIRGKVKWSPMGSHDLVLDEQIGLICSENPEAGGMKENIFESRHHSLGCRRLNREAEFRKWRWTFPLPQLGTKISLPEDKATVAHCSSNEQSLVWKALNKVETEKILCLELPSRITSRVVQHTRRYGDVLKPIALQKELLQEFQRIQAPFTTKSGVSETRSSFISGDQEGVLGVRRSAKRKKMSAGPDIGVKMKFVVELIRLVVAE